MAKIFSIWCLYLLVYLGCVKPTIIPDSSTLTSTRNSRAISSISSSTSKQTNAPSPPLSSTFTTKETSVSPTTSTISIATPSSTTETSTTETSTTETSTTETPTTETSTSETSTTETPTTETSTTETSTTETPTTETPTTETSTAEISTTKTSTTETSTTETSTTPSPTTPIHIIQQSFTWRSSELKENPIVFAVPEGYISAKVSNVDMSKGNYLLMVAGDTYSSEATEGRVFANKVGGPYYYLFQTKSVYAYVETRNKGDDEAEAKYEFTVTFTQTDGPTTTISTTPTTTVSLPPTQEGDSIYVTVNVSGRALGSYNQNTIKKFQECVVIMATNYCEEQNIYLTQEITKDYVLISDITSCPYTWPHSEICVRIKFKLPVFYKETDKWQGYELSTEHLEIMWLRWAELDDQCLRENSFDVYEEPNIEASIVWWAVGISLVTVVFIGFLWFLKSFSSRVKAAIRKRNRRRNSDTTTILSEKKDSLGSLTPHYLSDHIDTPKLFEN